ncbi:hypothetical protein MKX03_012696 [Papaver bracteatum]|nr:hypothetical protein MKX03_012696 [Papaver bracteatum]
MIHISLCQSTSPSRNLPYAINFTHIVKKLQPIDAFHRVIAMECLPSDVVLDILSRLPVDCVLDCKLVCKRLLNLLTHRRDQFAKMHSRRQLLQLAGSGDASSSSSTGLLFAFKKDEEDRAIGQRLYYGDNYNEEMNIHDNFSYKTLQQTRVSFPRKISVVAIVGSCNGLICLNRYHHDIPDPIHICNPNTGEYVNLPEYTLNEENYAAAYGFGYVHSVTSDQYKVVRIYYPDLEEYENGEVQVYTIGSSSGWRTIGTTSYQLYTPRPLGVFVNGALHWIDGINMNIVAFNLADEEFRIIQPPPCYNHLHYCVYSLRALRGNLFFCSQPYEKHRLDIWSLKKNATEASWSRDFSIAAKEIHGKYPVIPLLITKKNVVLFVDLIGSVLYCYDPKTDTVIKLWDVREWELMGITAVPHMNSLVSLKALGERCESKKEVLERSLEDAEY